MIFFGYYWNFMKFNLNKALVFFKTCGPFPASIYLLKVNNRNTETRCEICSKLRIKIANGVVLVSSSFWYLYCWLGTYFTPFSSVSIANFEHVIADWASFQLDPALSNWMYKSFIKSFIFIICQQHNNSYIT